MNRPTKLLTIPQAADRLGCSRYHVYDLMKDGKLRRFNASRTPGKTLWRVAESDVQAYIESIEVPLPQAG